jgi:hypothetical protein
MFSNWTWQKWTGRLLPFAIAVVSSLWKLMAPEGNPNWEPSWWIPVSSLVILVVNTIIGLIPAKQKT